jgi:hypothetical protein
MEMRKTIGLAFSVGVGLAFLYVLDPGNLLIGPSTTFFAGIFQSWLLTMLAANVSMAFGKRYWAVNVLSTLFFVIYSLQPSKGESSVSLSAFEAAVVILLLVDLFVVIIDAGLVLIDYSKKAKANG